MEERQRRAEPANEVAPRAHREAASRGHDGAKAGQHQAQADHRAGLGLAHAVDHRLCRSIGLGHRLVQGAGESDLQLELRRSRARQDDQQSGAGGGAADARRGPGEAGIDDPARGHPYALEALFGRALDPARW